MDPAFSVLQKSWTLWCVKLTSHPKKISNNFSEVWQLWHCSRSSAIYAFARRAFLPRLSMSAEVGHCVAMTWSGYATMQLRGIIPSPKEKKMKEQLKKILSLVDLNQDETARK